MRRQKNRIAIVFIAAVLGWLTQFYAIAAGDESTAIRNTDTPSLSALTPASLPTLVRPPQFEVPKAGNTMDESFKVNLEGISAGTRCVSIIENQATILISRNLLDGIVKGRPKAAQSEEDRIVMLNADRAVNLLNNITSIKDNLGCDIIQTPLDTDSSYLVAALLQSGQAGIIDNETSWQKYTLYVRFKGIVIAPLMGKGDILFSFEEKSTPFLTVRWWIS